MEKEKKEKKRSIFDPYPRYKKLEEKKSLSRTFYSMYAYTYTRCRDNKNK